MKFLIELKSLNYKEMINNKQLSYSFLNEDVGFEAGILEKNKNIFVIAGSGERVVSLLLKEPKKIFINDIKKEQLFLTELKIETYRQLSYKDFLVFWDFFDGKQDSKKRENIFNNLKLKKNVKNYFLILLQNNNWDSILYEGKWEKLFKKVGTWNNFITSNKIKKIFSLRDDEYKKFLDKKFPWKRFRFSLWFLGRAIIFNSLFYKGSFPKNTMDISTSEFYVHTFEKLFKNLQNTKNYFLEFLFFGRILYLPEYLEKENFKKIKKNINNSQIIYLEGNFFEEIVKQRDVDFISISNVISYLNDNDSRGLLNKIEKHMNKGGMIVTRGYLKWPKIDIPSDYIDITQRYKAEILKEKTQMYQIKIYQKL